MESMLGQLLLPAVQALAYYAALFVIMRPARKRLPGQTTTSDLIRLATPGVAVQSTALDDGWPNAVVFVITVFAVHRGLAAWCAHSTWIRHLVRGKPRVLVRDGKVIEQALQREGVSRDELQAGLRKLGYDAPEAVK